MPTSKSPRGRRTTGTEKQNLVTDGAKSWDFSDSRRWRSNCTIVQVERVTVPEPLCVRSHTDTHSHSHTYIHTMAGTARGRFRRATWHMPMVSLKLMAGAARSMVVASARTTAAEIAARWCARTVRGAWRGEDRPVCPGTPRCLLTGTPDRFHGSWVQSTVSNPASTPPYLTQRVQRGVCDLSVHVLS